MQLQTVEKGHFVVFSKVHQLQNRLFKYAGTIDCLCLLLRCLSFTFCKNASLGHFTTATADNPARNTYPTGSSLARPRSIGIDSLFFTCNCSFTLVIEVSFELEGSRTSDLREFSKFRDFSENRSKPTSRQPRPRHFQFLFL
jgi:hypothetical protein